MTQADRFDAPLFHWNSRGKQNYKQRKSQKHEIYSVSLTYVFLKSMCPLLHTQLCASSLCLVCFMYVARLYPSFSASPVFVAFLFLLPFHALSCCICTSILLSFSFHPIYSPPLLFIPHFYFSSPLLPNTPPPLTIRLHLHSHHVTHAPPSPFLFSPYVLFLPTPFHQRTSIPLLSRFSSNTSE